MAPHECKQAGKIEDIEASTVRVHKELYEGREGRQPVLVRVDRCERIVTVQAYVATAVLISAIIGAGTIFFRSLTEREGRRTASAARYEPNTRN